MIRRLFYWISTLISVLVLSLLLLFSGLVFTSTGAQWLLKQVPGLTVQGFQGQLANQWQAKQVQWQSDSLSIKLEGVSFSWHPSCLLDRKICLNKLDISKVSLVTSEQVKVENSQLPLDWSSLRLPAITLPELNLLKLVQLNGIKVNQLSLGRLKVNSQQHLHNLKLAADWQGTHIRLQQLEVQSSWLPKTLQAADSKIQLQGWLLAEDNWPLQLNLTSELSELPLQLSLTGDFEKLQLKADLTTATKQESAINLAGWVNLLQPTAPLDLTLTWNNLDPRQLHSQFANWPSNIQLDKGKLALQGNLETGWQFDVNTQQRLNEQPLTLNLGSNLSWQRLQIKSLDIKLNETNWLALKLDLSPERWQSNLDLKVSDLNAFSQNLLNLAISIAPELVAKTDLIKLHNKHAIAGDLQLSTHFDVPAATGREGLQQALSKGRYQLNIATKQLTYTAIKLANTNLKLSYSGQESNQEALINLQLTNQELKAGEFLLEALKINLAGSLDDHQVTSDFIIDNQPLEFGAQGGVQLNNIEGMQWHYQLATISTERFKPWLPEDLRWHDQIAGELKGQWQNQQLTTELALNSGPGKLAIRLEDTLNKTFSWVPLAYQLLNIKLTLDKTQLNAHLTLDGEQLGYVNTKVTLALKPSAATQQRVIQGKYQLDGLDLQLFSPFIALDQFSGQLRGQGEIRGHLLAPELVGNLQLKDVLAADELWPVSLQKLNGEILLQGDSIKLQADFYTGEAGKDGYGKLTGELGWTPEFTANLRLEGEAFKIRVEPYANLQVTPDLTLSYQQNAFLLAGQVRVPSGLVSIQQLPKQAIKVSEDAQVVGREAATSNVPRVDLDLEIMLGNVKEPDKPPLKLEALGLNAEIQGRLTVGNAMQTRGELLLVKGVYQSWGQDLKLRKARLNFAGPISLPFLDIEAVREVQDITVGIHMTGRVDHPETEIFSEPSMANEQALSWLILGRPLRTEKDENTLNAAAISYGLKQASGVTGRLGEKFGLKDFQLIAEGGGSETSVVASGYINDRLSVSYGVGVYDEVTRFVVRYDLTRQVYIEAASSLASSLDIFWRLNF